METSKTVAIRVVNDAVYASPDEWFELQLFGATGRRYGGRPEQDARDHRRRR
jgi:hypothetical protein